MGEHASSESLIQKVTELQRWKRQLEVLQAYNIRISSPASFDAFIGAAGMAAGLAMGVAPASMSLLLAHPDVSDKLFDVFREPEGDEYFRALIDFTETCDVYDLDEVLEEADTDAVVVGDEKRDLLAPLQYSVPRQDSNKKVSQLKVSMGISSSKHGALSSKHGGSFFGEQTLEGAASNTKMASGELSRPASFSLGTASRGAKASGILSPPKGRGALAASGTAGLMGLTFSPSNVQHGSILHDQESQSVGTALSPSSQSLASNISSLSAVHVNLMPSSLRLRPGTGNNLFSSGLGVNLEDIARHAAAEGPCKVLLLPDLPVLPRVIECESLSGRDSEVRQPQSVVSPVIQTLMVVAIPAFPIDGGMNNCCVGALIVPVAPNYTAMDPDMAVLAGLANVISAGRMRIQELEIASQSRARKMGFVQMIQAVSHEVTVPAIIKRIVGVAYELLHADRVSVFLVDREHQELVLAVSEDAAGVRLSLSTGIVGHCASSGSVINIADAYDSPLFDKSVDIRTGYRTRSILAFPVRDANGEMAAVIQAINKSNGDHFTNGDVRMLSLVADTAGVTLHKAKLLQDALLARAANAALVDVVKMSNELDEFESLDALTYALTEIAHRLVDAERMTLFIVDEVKKELFTNVEWSELPVADSALDCDLSTPSASQFLVRVPFGSGVAGMCALTGETLIVRDCLNDARYEMPGKVFPGEKNWRNILCLPVRTRPKKSLASTGKPADLSGGRIVAVLCAANKRGTEGFTTTDVEMLSALSSEVATAIDKRALQLAFGKAVADEANESSVGATGGSVNAGPGKMSSLLGQFIRPTVAPAAPGMRTVGSVRRMSVSSEDSTRGSVKLSSTELRGQRNTETGIPPLTLNAVSVPRRKSVPENDAPLASGALGAALPMQHTSSFEASPGKPTLVKSTAHNGMTNSKPVHAATIHSEADGYAGLDWQPWRSRAPRLGRSAAAHTAPQSWGWDILAADDLSLCASVLDMVHTMDLISTLMLDIGSLASFIDEVRVAYRANPYHNFKHGISVAHVCFLGLFHAPVVSVSLLPIERLALLLAALCHDVDHPGVNNAYESNALTTLAIQYNDMSVLEHHHAAVMFELLRAGERGTRPVNTAGHKPAGKHSSVGHGSSRAIMEDTASILQLSRADFAVFRRTAIAGILATDMTHHQGLTEQARRRAAPSKDGAEIEPLPAKLIVELMVHSADLSNPVLPSFTAVQGWADLVCCEFSAQVTMEKEQGLPFAPHMEGLTSPAAVAKLQLGFIDYVVAPLWTALALIVPEFACATENMASNRRKWKQILDANTAVVPMPLPAGK